MGKTMRLIFKVISIFALMSLAACGGGGSSTPPTPPPSVNASPIAVVPTNFEVIEASMVSLDGSSSTDDISISSFSWEQTSGESISLSNANSAIASFVAPNVSLNQTSILIFQLTVSDSEGATSTDTVTVTVIDTPSQLTLSGKITFDVVPHTNQNALDYNNISQAVVRGATVELLDGTSNSIVQTSISNNNGDYSFAVLASSSYKVRVKAELKSNGIAAGWDFSVVDNTSNQALYAMQSVATTVQTSSVTLNLNAASGWTGSNYGSARVAAPFAILDDIYQAKEKVLSVDASVFFTPLKLNWSVNNIAVSGDDSMGEITTSHFNGSEIFILGDEDADTDEYDDHVIIHEWGHYFESSLSRSESVGGAHAGTDKLDARVALGEGFGNALSGMVTDDSFYRDSFGTNQSQGFSINVEANPTNNRGWYSESSVQSILYDLYDGIDDGADNLSLGFGPIYNALVNGERTTEAFTSIFSLVNKIKVESSTNSPAIDALLASQDIVVADDFGSTETNDGGDNRNLPVYKNLMINGASVSVCSFDMNGQFNKLGNRQFLRFLVTADGSYNFTAIGQSTGDDPDLQVYKQGTLIFMSEVVGNEITTQTLTAGQYVMDAYEFVNIQGSPQKDTCIDITMSSN